MARKSVAKSTPEIRLPAEAKIEQLLAAFEGRDNEEILDFMVGEPEFIRCIPDDKRRAEAAKSKGLDTVPAFDKTGRQRLQEHIRSVRHKWDKRMADIEGIADALGEGEAVSLDEIQDEKIQRFQIDDNGPIDTIFGDGLTPGVFGPVLGKTYLVGGDEGVGKTRMCIAWTGLVSDPDRKDIAKIMKARESEAAIIYFQNEVPAATFKQWASGKVKAGSKVVVSEQCRLQNQLALIEKMKPLAVVVDSFHMILECDNLSGVIRTLNIYRSHAINHGYTLILICHLNKAGDVAGSRKLSYLVDCVMKAQGGLVPGQFTFGCPKKNRYGRSGVSILCQHTNDGIVIVNSEKGRGASSFGGAKPLIILAPKHGLKPLGAENVDPNAINKKHDKANDPDNGGKKGKQKNYKAAADVVAAPVANDDED